MSAIQRWPVGVFSPDDVAPRPHELGIDLPEIDSDQHAELIECVRAKEKNRNLSAEQRGRLDCFKACMEWQEDRWVLRALQEGLLKAPISVDFVAGKNAHRRHQKGKEPLVQAMKPKDGVMGHVLDATAGLGRDGFILASHGFRVSMLERHPAVAWLLWDGLRRGLEHADSADMVSRMNLHHGDALGWMKTQDSDAFQSVYLDPMFSKKQSTKKTAQVKKDMQVFRTLVGDDEDSEALVGEAIRLAQRRVVVKRARHAEALYKKADYSLVGKSNRFDVYSTKVSSF